MLSKPVLKQCIRSNGKLWAFFTAITCLILILLMWSYDVGAFSNMADAVEGTKFESIASSMTSFLGSLENFYKMVGILMGMVYVIITSSNLIVSEVDSGSMAYTLSTPIQRSSVVITKMVFMIGSVLLMFAIITGVGIGGAELTQHIVVDEPITDDVEAAASALDRRESYVRDHLYIVKDDTYALKSGAEARGMDTDSYLMYLDMKMLQNSYKAAADVLTEERKDYYEDSDDENIDDDFIEITKEELAEDPSLILNSTDAIKDGASVMGMTEIEYKSYIKDIISENEGAYADQKEPEADADQKEPEADADQKESEAGADSEAIEGETDLTEGEDTVSENAEDAVESEQSELSKNSEDMAEGEQSEVSGNSDAAEVSASGGTKEEGETDFDAESVLSIAMTAAAKELNTDTGTLSENMLWMKEDNAMEAEMAATGQSRETLETLINTALANNALAADNSISFDMETYLWLNIGCCLLILAFSAMGFFASCIFNRSKNALVVGGGLPFVFYILSIIIEISSNLENLKYLTITTLFNSSEILVLGDFGIGLAALAGISVVLYAAGCIIFCKRDLPL